jgi:hypothetical protein
MKKIFDHLILKYLPVFALALIVGCIVGANFTPNTYLSGWDTLHPEFNFPLAFERILNGVWRTDQGLGTVAIQSHMADLPRVILLWLGSLVLPINLLRYGLFFITLAVGPVGIYFLVNHVLTMSHARYAKFASFIAGLLYLCNPITLQHFSVPLEMFAFHYALVPWLFLTALHILEHGSKRLLAIFSILTILAIPQAHTATLFYAYFVTFGLFLITYVLLHIRAWKKTLTQAILLIGITLSLNAFWMLPNIYAVVMHGKEVQTSKINSLFTPEAMAKSQNFGTAQNLILGKNFLFDWQLFNTQKGVFENVLEPWLKHLDQPVVVIFFTVLFGLAILGIAEALRTKNKPALAILPVWIVSTLMLLNGSWPMTTIFNWLATVSPVASEALRFPFTKFSILYLVTYTMYVGLGVAALYQFVIHDRYFRMYITAVMVGLLIYSYNPAFTGHLVHPAMRVTIPNAYSEMFDWFNDQSKIGRVAVLPIHSFWGWTYYDWGYQGAGFLQFGIPQPILDRDYDRWSPYNEQYGREMAYAVYSQNPTNITNVLKKYNVKWILIDTSVISPGNNDSSTLTWLLPKLVDMSDIVRKAKTFGDHITVYEVLNSTSERSVTLYDSVPVIGPTMDGSYEDTTFKTVGTYMTKLKNNIVDPTRSHFTHNERLVDDLEMTEVSEVSASNSVFLSPLASCAIKGKLYGKRTLGNTIQYKSTDGPICDHMEYPNLAHDTTYIIEVTSRNIQGFPMQLCVSNDLTGHCDLFVHLHANDTITVERFIVPALDDHGAGYTLNWNNFTIHGRTTINEIQSVKLFETAHIVSTITEKSATSSAAYTIYRALPIFYTVRVSSNIADTAVLTLNQSFENGWVAWGAGKHVLVNNWANGWVLPATSKATTIYIFFWPQILEWVGLLMIPVVFLSSPLLRQCIHRSSTVFPKRLKALIHILREIP